MDWCEGQLGLPISVYVIEMISQIEIALLLLAKIALMRIKQG